jgi:hypothetical protein
MKKQENENNPYNKKEERYVLEDTRRMQ